MHTRLAAILFMAIACTTLAGCDEGLPSVTGPTPDLEPTFTAIQRDIFNAADSSARLACTQCHNAVGSRFNGLDLTSAVSYANLVNIPSRGKPGAIRVIPGDPENSYLVHKLEGRPGIVGQRMPFGNGPFLTDGQMLVIKRWIALGARND
jgi:hypothetical protein